MSSNKAVSKRALRDLVKSAEEHFCMHQPGEHDPGHCDLLLITPEDITTILEDAS